MNDRGGKPSGEQRKIPVARPTFDGREEQLVAEVLRSGWVTQGPRVIEFEKAVADYVGAEHAIAVSSATTALFLGLHALGIGQGDQVIVPSLSFIATANSVVHAGATPVFVDVDPQTLNIDPAAIESAITPNTRAVMPVDQLGMPADIDRINEIAARHKLLVIEDAACAIGSRYNNKPVGSGADLTCFSFHPRKVITTGEGGMITTNNTELAENLQRLRHQGMSVSDLQRHSSNDVIIEQYPQIGYNFRLSDIQAAVGVAQMQKLDTLLARRRQIAAEYDAALAEIDAVEAPAPPAYAQPSYQSYIVRLRHAAEQTRNDLLNELNRRGVASRRGLMAIHREPCYQGATVAGSLEHTEAGADQTFLLPLYPDMAGDDPGYVVEQLAAAVEQVSAGERNAP